MTRVCAHCGAGFTPAAYTGDRQRYCSANCGKAASYRRKVGPSPLSGERSCATCPTRFVPRHVAQRYCCASCKRTAARVKVPQRWRHVSSRYKLSPAVFDEMLQQQDGRCVICSVALNGTERDRDAPQVDHDHDTGQVRAILCRLCNTALGNFRDDPEIAERAARYLRHWKAEARAVQ